MKKHWGFEKTLKIKHYIRLFFFIYIIGCCLYDIYQGAWSSLTFGWGGWGWMQMLGAPYIEMNGPEGEEVSLDEKALLHSEKGSHCIGTWYDVHPIYSPWWRPWDIRSKKLRCKVQSIFKKKTLLAKQISLMTLPSTNEYSLKLAWQK